MDMIKGLMFDLDGTLLDRTRSLQEFINTQYERHADLLQKVTSQNYVEDFLEYDQNGYLHKKHVYRKLVEKYKLDHHLYDILLADYYMEFHGHCVPMDDLDVLISYLKESSLMSGLMTNGETIFQTKTIEALSLEDVFHCALISEEEGIKKPSPEFFYRGLQQLDLQSNETIFVGDHPYNDIQAAKKLGMYTIWVKSIYYEKPKEADFMIDSLSEIPEIVQSLLKGGST
ncbi:HAD family hydrolase [Pseudalkalibacillus salsuginis]|uniref:HAD family hydrolase n=1 Tax=Pseudalkalibacillus salsuginis TaxID=2910972 RepID=UPI001F3A13FF|nr:HAD family hydrolase [Pseudalkalibacillus salsuginis]MCF6409301.1 HAD family hydrolase [Pseudalkalibacillus salsuginis]